MTRQRQNYYFIMTSATTELRDTHRYFNRFVMSNPYRSEIFFSVFGSKESELIHVKHSTIEQNLLQVTTCSESKLDKNMSNKKVCMSTEHNNFLTVISKKVALQYQTAANLLKKCNFRFHSNEFQ